MGNMRVTRRSCLKSLAAGAAAVQAGLAGGMTAAAEQAAEAGKGGVAVHIVRFEKDGRASYGVLEGDRVQAIRGTPFEGIDAGTSHALKEVKLLFPCEPTKVLAMALNYKSHAGEQPPPAKPEVFIKAPTALLDPEGAIVFPPGTQDVHYEGELVVVIGKKAKDVSKEAALGHVFGYTCGNDVSARDWQKNDRQWWRAKGSDTFAPLGPWIVRGIDAADLLLTTRVNGEEKQRARTSQLIFDVPTIVSFISKHMTLLPGDLIYTGTPGTTSAMKSGDRVEVEIEKIGVLRNRIA